MEFVLSFIGKLKNSPKYDISEEANEREQNVDPD